MGYLDKIKKTAEGGSLCQNRITGKIMPKGSDKILKPPGIIWK
jgi:hypothetical protein